MQWCRFRLVAIFAAAFVLGSVFLPGAPRAQSMLSGDYVATNAPYTESERSGREIWFFATAFNDRFFTYAYPQRLGAAIDWYKVLAAEHHDQLFQGWGAIPDPDCCIPGQANCPAKSLEETYGFPYCPGDAALLSYVGKEGYKDPACLFQDGPYNKSTPHGAEDQRQSACDLRFGTSTGALGLRKFPNPRFDVQGGDKTSHWSAGVVLSVAA